MLADTDNESPVPHVDTPPKASGTWSAERQDVESITLPRKEHYRSPQRAHDEQHNGTRTLDEGVEHTAVKQQSDQQRSETELALHHKSGPEDEHETISSAVYYPHLEQASRLEHLEPGSVGRQTDVEYGREHDEVHPSDPRQGGRPRAESHQIELSLQSEDEQHKVSLQGDIDEVSDDLLASRRDTSSSASAPFSLSASESEAESEHRIGNETPRASDATRTSDTGLAIGAAFPPRAVLKPFSHQVGGHTALYRFSRRAICKKLNNKENKFYETVERFHPDLLQFLPK